MVPVEQPSCIASARPVMSCESPTSTRAAFSQLGQGRPSRARRRAARLQGWELRLAEHGRARHRERGGSTLSEMGSGRHLTAVNRPLARGGHAEPKARGGFREHRLRAASWAFLLSEWIIAGRVSLGPQRVLRRATLAGDPQQTRTLRPLGILGVVSIVGLMAAAPQFQRTLALSPSATHTRSSRWLWRSRMPGSPVQTGAAMNSASGAGGDCA
jgi:hypothetical protein